ncbi:MAG: folate family ECF transporter S component [Clostridia bacterium]|nr:folate family ECF transporter S component [Clostridia bacterium]
MSIKSSIKYIAYCGVLTALAIVCNTFTIMLAPNKALSFVYIPAFTAGIALGPIAGLIVGGLGDLLGHFIAPKGDFQPLITLSSALIGLIPGLVYMAVNRISKTVQTKSKPQNADKSDGSAPYENDNATGANLAYMESRNATHRLEWKKVAITVWISMVLCFLIASTINNFSLWFYYLYKNGSTKSFWLYYLGRLPIIGINLVTNGILCTGVIGVLMTKFKYFFSFAHINRPAKVDKA